MSVMTKEATLRVMVVDDHSTLAELLTGAIDRESDLMSVGHATTGAAGLAMFESLRPDVVLMDIQLPDMDGFAAAAQILAVNPEARVIVLTANVTANTVADAAASGVCGFVSKDGHFADLLRTIRTAKPGNLMVDLRLVTQFVDQPRAVRPPLARPLSARELSVLVRMADGNHVTRIARELGISSHTCRGHIKRVLSKLGAHSQLEAVIIAVRMGLVEINDQAAKSAIFDAANVRALS